jgi:type I restriction enzyme, S subunit
MTSLPQGWGLRPLNQLGGSDRPAVKAGPFGSALKKEFYSRAGYRVYGQEQVIADNLAVGDYYIDENRFQALKSCEVRAGDVLVSLVGTFGKASIVPPDAEPGIINPRLIRLSLDPDRVEPRYLKAFLGSPLVQQQFEAVAHGGTMGVLNATTVGPLELPLPPLNEQRRIVAKLEALQSRSRRAREALDAVPPLLEKLRQSILAAAFRGDLTKDWRAQNPNPEPASALLARIRTERRKKWEASELAKLKAKGKPPTNDAWKARYKEPEPADTTTLPELPDRWCWASVDEISPGDAPSVYGIILPGDDVPGGVPYVRPVDMRTDGTMDIASLKRTSAEIATQYERARLRTGDVVLSIVGTIGKVIVVPPELDGGNITQSSARIRPPETMSSEYLSHALLSPQLVNQYDSLRFGNAVQRLNVEDVRALAIPLGPEAEQIEVVRRLKSALAAQPNSTMTAVAKRLAELNSAILAKAFRGELVPQDPNDEPADVMLARLNAEAQAESPRKRAHRAKAAD